MNGEFKLIWKGDIEQNSHCSILTEYSETETNLR